MSLINREFVADFFKALAAIVFLICVIVLLDTLIEFYAQVFNSQESRAGWTAIYFICVLPKKVLQALPMCSAASVLWVATQKARHNEILAYEAGGLSPKRLAAPFFYSGLAVSLLAVGLGELVVPNAESAARFVKRVKIDGREAETYGVNTRIHQRGIGNRFYFIESFDAMKMEMDDPSVIDFWDDDCVNPKTRIDAAKAVRVSDNPPVWEFQDARVWGYDKLGAVTSFKRVPKMRDTELAQPFEKEIARSLDRREDAARMTINELWEYIALLKAQHRPTTDLQYRLHERVSISFGSVVMALLMCALALRPAALKVLTGFGGGIALMVAYQGVVVICQHFGKLEALDFPMLAAWAPNVLFFVGSAIMLSRSGRL